MALCLVVEDEGRQAHLLEARLKAAGHEVALARTAAEALARCEEKRPEVILLDLGLPDADGLDLIPKLRAAAPLARTVVLTGRDTARGAIAALQAGARHYLVKPWDPEELLLVVAREARAADAAELQERTAAEGVFWGDTPAMERLRHELAKLARSPQTPVLIAGETGTGKEIVARELHRLTGGSGLFIPLNCAAVPSELLESELFGHERGAFTGAVTRHRGMAELARDGTLFLDEIAEMPLHLQSKLLRFVQDHAFRRVGGEELLSSNCRIVAATHRDLEALQSTERFRSDLYFRLAVVTLHVPALRERRADLLPLADFLLRELAQTLGRAYKPLDPAAEAALLEQPWPGNVRQLRNRLERGLVLSEGAQIGTADMDLPSQPASPRPPPDAEDPAKIRAALEAEGWNISRAARRLGIARHRLRYRMQVLGLSRG